MSVSPSMGVESVNESLRTGVREACDVLVAGGGPAGVCAAIAAARAGASVRLIETHGCLGGIWTAGLLCWILDHQNKSGLIREILDHLDAMNARRWNAYDPEAMKLLLERLCLQSGVRIRLHTRVVAAQVRERTITHVLTESKSGREAWAARVCIDCTGDGDLAALAGCSFDIGRPASGWGAEGPDRAGETQPMTLMALVTGASHADLLAMRVERGEGVSERLAKDTLRNIMHGAGLQPSYADPTFFPIRDDLHAIMFNHEYGRDGLSAQDVTDATLRARQELNTLIDGLRGIGGPWAGIRLVATAEQIGIREGRRIRGRYTLGTDDLIQSVAFDDAVCRVTFGIDVHATNPDASGSRAVEKGSKHLRISAYDIPERCLISAELDNLLMAGRCISGDFLAHSSYRVTGNAAALGEAAGKLAARLCAPARPERDSNPR